MEKNFPRENNAHVDCRASLTRPASAVAKADDGRQSRACPLFHKQKLTLQGAKLG